ncbi:MAG: GntR family transcriptional regulator [Actinomycetota bacterium]
METFAITIDRGAVEPASAQLKAALRRLIDTGVIEPGDRLPTVRAFADRLLLAPNTVARAYRELEHEAYLVGRGRAGTFVAPKPPRAQREPDLDDLAVGYLARTCAIGVDADEAVDAVRRVASQHPPA